MRHALALKSLRAEWHQTVNGVYAALTHES
jgi:hypothetical protein